MKKLSDKAQVNIACVVLIIVFIPLLYGMWMLTHPKSAEPVKPVVVEEVVPVEEEVATIVLPPDTPIVLPSTDTQAQASAPVEKPVNIVVDSTGTEQEVEVFAPTVFEKPGPPEEPTIDPTLEKPVTIPPQELLDQNPNYISASDTDKVKPDPVTGKLVPIEPVVETPVADEEVIQLVPDSENPFKNGTFKPANVTETKLSDEDKAKWGVPGEGDKF